ncbi:hypothetical protein ABZ929_21030 [Streptomyces physcomitrii]|uniref:hypothetical protein n=1 Tax=Streptomyces physcomitrii TaxID=2724184 RepID=UPI003412B194
MFSAFSVPLLGKQALAIEAIRGAEARTELTVHDILTELTDTDAEILAYLK